MKVFEIKGPPNYSQKNFKLSFESRLQSYFHLNILSDSPFSALVPNIKKTGS